MRKLQILLIESSSEIVEHFSQFIRNSDFSSKIMLRTISSSKLLKEFLELEPNIDILLLDSREDLAHLMPSILTIFLSENQLQEDSASLALYKYQPLQQLFSKMIHMYFEHSKYPNLHLQGKRKTKVISFYSSVGTCGKTTIALNFVKQMGLLNRRVLYLNLEFLCSTQHFFEVSGEFDFANIIYYLKSKSNQLPTKLEEFIHYDSNLRADYFEPCTNIRDILDMKEDDIQYLLDSLVAMKMYDYIFINLESTTHERIIRTFSYSDLIYWIVVDDIQCLSKTEVLLREIERIENRRIEDFIFEKVVFLLNKFTGSFKNEFEAQSIQIQHLLPYIPEWKSIKHAQELLMSSVFNEDVLKLCHTLAGKHRSEMM